MFPSEILHPEVLQSFRKIHDENILKTKPDVIKRILGRFFEDKTHRKIVRRNKDTRN